MLEESLRVSQSCDKEREKKPGKHYICHTEHSCHQRIDVVVEVTGLKLVLFELMATTQTVISVSANVCDCGGE